MDPLERLIATARLRLRVQHAVARTPRIVITVAAVMLAALVLGKILPAVLPVWWITVSVLAAAGLAAFFALLLLDPPSRLHAAIEADRVLGLRDRLSVALASRGSSDPFARAAVADAEARAADPALRNTLRRGLPLEPPSGWWWAIPVLMAAALVQFLVNGEDGRYRAGLERLLEDAVEGRMSSRIAQVTGVRGRRALGSKAGRVVLSVYFTPDFELFKEQYDAFLAVLMQRGSGTAIWRGRNPFEVGANEPPFDPRRR